MANWCQAQGVTAGELLSVSQTWRLGQRWYDDRLQPDWRRRTREERQAILSDLGLVGEFWSLEGR